MLKHKVGDKVRYIGTYFGFSKQKPIGIISHVSGRYVQVIFKDVGEYPFWCYGYELNSVIKVGEQLEFAFMSKEDK